MNIFICQHGQKMWYNNTKDTTEQNQRLKGLAKTVPGWSWTSLKFGLAQTKPVQNHSLHEQHVMQWRKSLWWTGRRRHAEASTIITVVYVVGVGHRLCMFWLLTPLHPTQRMVTVVEAGSREMHEYRQLFSCHPFLHTFYPSASHSLDKCSCSHTTSAQLVPAPALHPQHENFQFLSSLLIAHFILHHPISGISCLLHFVSLYMLVISLLHIHLISLIPVHVHHHHFCCP